LYPKFVPVRPRVIDTPKPRPNTSNPSSAVQTIAVVIIPSFYGCLFVRQDGLVAEDLSFPHIMQAVCSHACLSDRPPPVRLVAIVSSRDFAIERASPADAPAVIQLIRRVYKEYGFIFEPTAELPDLFAFAQHYVAPHGAFFVVRHGGQVVGSAGVERLQKGKAELHRVYLDAELRGRGLGYALVKAAIAWCQAEGIGHLVLWSDTRFDRAHTLYERMGFQRTGERALADINGSHEYRYERSLLMDS
jgi:putative acetyltransferase